MQSTHKLPNIARIPSAIDNSVSTSRALAPLDFMLEELDKEPLMLPRQPTALLLQTEKKDNSSKGKSIFSSPSKKPDLKPLPTFSLSSIFSKLEIATLEELYPDDFEDIATLEALSLDSKTAPAKKA